MRSTRALSISVGTHCVVLAFLLLAFKHELLHKTPERQKSLPHQARVLLQNNKSSPIVPMPQDNPPAPPSIPVQQTPPIQQQVVTAPVITPTPASVPHAPPSHSEQARKPLAKTHAQGAVPVVAEEPIASTAPPEKSQPIIKRMHAWKRAAQAQPPTLPGSAQATYVKTPAPEDYAGHSRSVHTPYLHHAMRAKPTERHAEQQSEASRAHAAAARFHNEYARKQLEDYIYSIVYAVGCTYNSSPFLLTANDVPYELSFIITLDRKGQLLSVTTDRPCPTARGEEWRKHVIACFYRSAPFRATPAQVPDPWTIPLRTDFESEFLSNTSSQPRPVIFRLTRAPY